MCAEAVWWRCHRRIIADYLLAAGETVFHILGRGHIEPARMTEGAQTGSAGLTYPALLSKHRTASVLSYVILDYNPQLCTFPPSRPDPRGACVSQDAGRDAVAGASRRRCGAA